MQMTLEKASKVDLIRAFNKLSTKKIVEVDYPSIGALNKIHTPITVEKVLAILVNDLATAFEGELSHQAEELAVEISTTYYNLSIEDVYLCFANIKKAAHYGKLTQNKVLNGLQTQLEDRLNQFEKVNYNKHLSNQYKGERTGGETELKKHKAAHATYYKNTHLK